MSREAFMLADRCNANECRVGAHNSSAAVALIRLGMKYHQMLA